MANDKGFAAGASAARNKIAKDLRTAGVPVRTSRDGCPPSNQDILAAISEVRNQPSHLGPRALILFHWSDMTYQFVIPASEIKRLAQAPEASYELFSAANFAGPNRYRHSFYLANHGQEVVVHHKRLWRDDGAVDIESTRIVFIDDNDQG